MIRTHKFLHWFISSLCIHATDTLYNGLYYNGNLTLINLPMPCRSLALWAILSYASTLFAKLVHATFAVATKPPPARTSEDCYPVAVLISLYFQCFEQTQALALIKVAWTTKPFSISMKRATMTPSNVRRLIRCISSYLPCFLITL